MPLTRFGLWLDQAMKRAGISSQRELARRVGRSHAAIWRWSNTDTMPSAEDIQTLAQVLRVSRPEIYSALGMWPNGSEDRFAEILDLLRDASDEELEEVTRYARYLRSLERSSRDSGDQ